MRVIAITGGPCAGKTTAMEELRERLERAGIRVALVGEAATDLINAGIAPWTCASMPDFQTRVIALQLEREAAAIRQAEADDIGAVICDRGICDSNAYLSDDEFQVALDANGLTRAQALARYDAVFHLESVAKLDPREYTKANNTARFENAEQAAAVDDRVISSWSAHPAFRVIENRDRFQEKVDELCEALIQLMNAPWQAAKGDSSSLRNDRSPILVSACLLGEPCRYDGKAQLCAAIIALAETHELVPVCPEQLGGLPTPRTPSEIQPDGSVRDATGADRTDAFESGARKTLQITREHGCTQAILKENSPSCGVHRIYDGTFSGNRMPGQGKTAALLANNGIEVFSEADLTW